MTEVDLVEEFFGEELGPDLIRAVQGTDNSHLHELRETHRAYARDYRLPPARSGEHRPYICPELFHRRPELTGGLLVGGTIASPDMEGWADAFAAADALKYHLLYSHSVAINSRLAYITDLFFDSPAERFEEYRERLATYLGFLHEIKPLVQKGIVFLIPTQRSHLDGRFGSYPPHLLKHDEWPKVDLTSLLRYVPGDILETSAAHDVYRACAESSILVTMLEEQQQGSRLDLYIPHPFFKTMLAAMLPAMAGSGHSKRISADAIRTADLIAAKIPGLDRLEMHDLVAIRENEETFESWRHALSRALVSTSQLEVDVLDDAAALNTIRQELADESRRLEEGAKSSRLTTKMGAGVRTFLVGAAGAVATAHFADPIAGVATAGATAAADLLWSFLARDKDQSTSALRRHYALFTDV